MSMIDFSELKTAEDVVQVAAELREQADEGRWLLGALANWFVPHRKSGRPIAEEIHTISWIARQIGIPRSVLSSYASNWAFWGDVHEEIPLGISWHSASMARQRVGWRPGQYVTDDIRGQAFALLEAWLEEPPKPSKIVTVEQYIGRAMGNLLKAIPLLEPTQRAKARIALAALEDIDG